MLVQELLNILARHDPNAEVITEHYNGGYMKIHEVKVIGVSLQETRPYFTGSIEEARDGELSVPAILLSTEH